MTPILIFRRTLLALSCACTVTSARPAHGQAPEVDTTLQRQLLERGQLDQSVRKMVMSPGATVGSVIMIDSAQAERIRSTDGENRAWLKELIGRRGWPTRSAVGAEAAHAAFLLVQHADRDTAFQRQALEQMSAAARAGEADLRDVAYLTDRVLVHAGKPQRYATQIRVVDGAPSVQPLEDSANVDARRHEMGLEPLAVYMGRAQVKTVPGMQGMQGMQLPPGAVMVPGGTMVTRPKP
ncbi:MAG: DUF6624 domain-containing protein [Gemmatimonadaceae bacterium]